MQLFRSLPPDKGDSFRQWARDNYQPHATINGTWHPVIQDECRRINEQAEWDHALACTTKRLDRYWINAPSTQQTMHSLHGTRVIADPANVYGPSGDYTLAYTISGSVTSFVCEISALSQGWPDTSFPSQEQQMTNNLFTCLSCGVVLDAEVFLFADSKHFFHPDGSLNRDVAGQFGSRIVAKRPCPACGEDIYADHR
jgi:hypothetical protein